MSLESLYQDIILEHSKQRTGEHLVEVPAGHASADNHQYNPTCGDEINLRLVLSDEQKDGEKVVESVSWEGDGCSISMAAASVLSEMAPGMTVGELQNHVDAFREMLRSRGQITLDEEEYGDMAGVFRWCSVFTAIWRHFPGSQSLWPASNARCSRGWQSKRQPARQARNRRTYGWPLR